MHMMDQQKYWHTGIQGSKERDAVFRIDDDIILAPEPEQVV